MSYLEEELVHQMNLVGRDNWEKPVREYRFAAHHVGLGDGIRDRLDAAGLSDWRFDFAFLDYKIAIEIEGATFSRGRHTRGLGFEDDCRKYNTANELGWTVYRFTGNMVNSGEAIKVIERIIENAVQRFER